MTGAPDIITSSQELRDLAPEVASVWSFLGQARGPSAGTATAEKAQGLLRELTARENDLAAKYKAALAATPKSTARRDPDLLALQRARQLVRETSVQVALAAARTCWGEDEQRDGALQTLQAELWSARTGCGTESQRLKGLMRRGRASRLDRYDCHRWATYFAALDVTRTDRELQEIVKATWREVGGEAPASIDHWRSDEAVALEIARVTAELSEIRVHDPGVFRRIVQTVLFPPPR